MAQIPSTYWENIVPHLKSVNVVTEMVLQESALSVPSGEQ